MYLVPKKLDWKNLRSHLFTSLPDILDRHKLHMDREQQVYDKSVTRVQRRCNGQAKISLKVQFQKKRVVLFCDWRERERERERGEQVSEK